MKRALFVGNSFFGDAVMSLPAINAFYDAHPSCIIDVVAGKATCEVYSLTDKVANVYAYPKSFLKRLRLARELSKNKYEAGIALAGGFHAAFFLKLANVKNTVGLKRDFRGPLLKWALDFDDNACHQVISYLKLVEPFGACIDACIDEADFNIGSHLNGDSGIRGEDEAISIGIAPFASSSKKEWGKQNYKELIKKLLDYSPSIHIFLAGSPNEKEKLDSFAFDRRITNIAGSYSLKELAAKLCSFSCFVANNSGLSHFAAACGCAVVCISGHSNTTKNAPFGKGHVIIKKDYACIPCSAARLKKCGDLRCIKDIDVDIVFEKVVELLAK